MPVTTVESAIRRTRMIAGFLLAYLVLLPIVIEQMVHVTPQKVDPTIFGAICVICAVEIVAALFIRSRYPLASEETASQSQDPRAIRRWLSSQIVSYAIAISTALYGVALGILGAPLRETASFYGVALVLLIL